ncbi:phosphoenolpyruvate--protein phosphotransferase [Tumebacillus flagellatus]|uniref:Phosphoenolpyruvate-protein phosphotransferase n=1 Tax=Tumebacillus flagellatus TaxID=1157490 RepID=A0A074LT09_9BACL|nr:phosphoenolpyruvate--protein phosphotransferase [Tumebacillus flagellatus]KEO84124.1 phosphoenolpyruvate-protein phosphotransferase [Tumebacillus flagellatus]
MAEQSLKGIGVSDGIRFGSVLLYQPNSASQTPVRETIDPSETDAELSRLQKAKDASYQELEDLVAHTRQTLGEDKAVILQGQQSFLADPSFYPEIERLVSSQHKSAELAVKQIVDQFVMIFESMPQEYMRERASDLKDIGNRMLAHLSGAQGVRLSEIREEIILVADDLTPSDTVQLNRQYVRGILTRIGGKTSHTAILARSLGIPAVLGIGDALDLLHDGDEVILDGTAGLVILNPEESTRQTYEQKQREEADYLKSLEEFQNQPAKTSDGKTFEIAANIGTPAEATAAVEGGAEGVGLYRTEFLFMNATSMPTEDEQFEAYKSVAETMAGRPVVIRTLDIGGDKELPYLSLPHEMNPFLGYRAIRLCLDRPELLSTQLRAILRASHYGKLKVMFPMISNLSEFRQAKAIFREVAEQLRKEGVPFDEAMEVGIMVEIPSAALLADQFAREVDFFSIGTNDLVQYTLAVDRMNEKVAPLYDYFHPAVVHLIHRVIDASHRAGKWTGMCGGMAGDPLAAPLLAGLGLDEWSMDANSIKKVKHKISTLHHEECKQLAEQALQLGTAEEVRALLGGK